MIRYQSNKQLFFAEFSLPFRGALDGNNRWVKLANLLPWDDLVRVYAQNLSGQTGRPTADLRVELGILLIQELMGYTDREVIAQVQENPYLQYFLGFHEYRYQMVFDPSLLVSIRKRLDRASIGAMTGEVEKHWEALEAKEASADEEKQDDDHSPGPSTSGKSSALANAVENFPASTQEAPEQRVTHCGELILDATAAELEIPYPTDLALLNEARQQSERIIDLLWSSKVFPGCKPRTHRRKAKTAYMAIARKRLKKRKEIRRGIKQQLQYLRRNIKIIKKLSGSATARLLLKRRDRELTETIGKVYAQQKQMYDEKKRRIAERIVNLYQPWVRPIKRGKAGTDVEFGPKLSVSLIGKVAYVDYFSWEAYNEGNYLKQQVKAYYRRYGFYPEVLIADTIYGNRENRCYLKKLGIRFSGKKLGRPVKLHADNRGRLSVEKRLSKAEQRKRNHIEGRFGVGRRRYGLDQVRTRLKETSETTICMAFFAMTVAAFLAACFARLLKLWWRIQTAYSGIIRQTGTNMSISVKPVGAPGLHA